MIIKPLDSNASHGVSMISSDEETEEHFGETMSFSRWEKCIVAERYIDGTEFTVDGVKTLGDFAAVFSVSETLKETTRKLISEYFRCPVYVFYFNEENGVLGVAAYRHKKRQKIKTR